MLIKVEKWILNWEIRSSDFGELTKRINGLEQFFVYEKEDLIKEIMFMRIILNKRIKLDKVNIKKMIIL